MNKKYRFSTSKCKFYFPKTSSFKQNKIKINHTYQILKTNNILVNNIKNK